MISLADREYQEAAEFFGIPNPKVPGSRPGRPTSDARGSALFSLPATNGVARNISTNSIFPAPGSTKVAIDDARSELDQMASHLTGGQGR